LSRLLKHLLASSGAAIAPGPGAIHVITEQADGRAALRIDDSGPPLDRDQLSLLFRPFAAVRRGNNGVALAICKVIVARMQGSLQASNKPEGGMSFRVELRLAAES
jgi:C4-dicarboxylate-specific signal transduction histidine kinase